jgi:NADH-quinone oxidoreductase subunit M
VSELHFPWLEVSILTAVIGAIWVGRLHDQFVASRHSLFFNVVVLLTTLGAWTDYEFINRFGVVPHEAQDYWNPLTKLLGREIFVIDTLSSPLLTLVALLYFLVSLTTLRTKFRKFSFAWTLASEAVVLATFCCEEPWLIIGLLALGTIPPYRELRARRQNTGVYVKHMVLFIILLIVGQSFVDYEGRDRQVHSLWGIVPLLIAIFIRSGIVPFHCWMGDLFERATFGTALLVAMPLVGAYATIRLVLPIAPDWVLRAIGLLSLLTAVYAAGIALVQTDARRFFCYLFLSHSALVSIGLAAVTPISLTGALCVWMALSISLGGFGLTLRALEARRGRLSLTNFQGLYDHTPSLAALFLITGLASVGFPGTFGFVGTEMLIDGAVGVFPYVGVAVIIASALNGIAVVRAYFRLFTGTRHTSLVSLGIGRREKFAVISLTALIFIGGLVPQYNVSSRYRAADRILRERAAVVSGLPLNEDDVAVPDHH